MMYNNNFKKLCPKLLFSIIHFTSRCGSLNLNLRPAVLTDFDVGAQFSTAVSAKFQSGTFLFRFRLRQLRTCHGIMEHAQQSRRYSVKTVSKYCIVILS